MSVPAILRASLTAIAVACAAAPVEAQQPYAYPNAGQTEAQQSKDRFECHQWAVSQSGFDPSTAPPLPATAGAPPPPPQAGYSDQQQQRRGGSVLGIGDGGFFQGGGMMGDAATGAALGAAGGAIAGDAGQGAAIGAVASTLFGALSRSSQPSSPPPQQQQAQQDYYYQQQQAQANQAYQQRMAMQQEYNRAFGACMSARSYTVQ